MQVVFSGPPQRLAPVGLAGGLVGFAGAGLADADFRGAYLLGADLSNVKNGDLAEFAGAAGELRQAFLCNPHDLQGVKDALMRAINVDGADAARRMRTMRRHLRAHDVAHWASSFLSALGVPAPSLKNSEEDTE